MESARRKRLSAGTVWVLLGVGFAAGGLAWSLGHPVAGGIAVGFLAGMLLSFTLLVWRSAPGVATGMAVAAFAFAGLQAWLNAAAVPALGIAAASSFAAWVVLVQGVGLGMVNREHVTALEDLGGSGTAGRALIVYHSVGGKFQPAVQRALAEGLKTQGWQVSLTSASRAAPTDLSGYRLLVLGVPVFAAQPARSILAYLRRVGGLNGLPVLLVVSGQGSTEFAVRLLRRTVESAHGRLVKDIEVWTERDNAERYGLSDPTAVLRREGEQLRVA